MWNSAYCWITCSVCKCPKRFYKWVRIHYLSECSKYTEGLLISMYHTTVCCESRLQLLHHNQKVMLSIAITNKDFWKKNPWRWLSWGMLSRRLLLWEKNHTAPPNNSTDCRALANGIFTNWKSRDIGDVFVNHHYSQDCSAEARVKVASCYESKKYIMM